MSRKDNLRVYQNITNGNMASASITSPATCIEWLDNIAIQLNFTGSPVGTFQIQVSVDYAQDIGGKVTNAGNWVAVTLPSSPVAAGAPGQIIIDLNQLASPWIRVVYTRTSGSGSLNSFISGKMI
jgi:hypothetical protein